MMGKARSSVAIVALAAAGTALAAPVIERLASPTLSGFVVGYTAGDLTRSIREEVPKGETVEAWTRMVTTQWFAGLTARATPVEFAENIRAGLSRSCSGAAVTPVTALKVAGRSAIRFDADCPNNGKGQRERFMLLAVAGSRDMHVKQVAFRGAASSQELAWAKAFLAATVLCAPGDRRPACQS